MTYLIVGVDVGGLKKEYLLIPLRTMIITFDINILLCFGSSSLMPCIALIHIAWRLDSTINLTNPFPLINLVGIIMMAYSCILVIHFPHLLFGCG